MKRLHGVTVAMTTPFTREDKIDVEVLEIMTNMYIEKGVHGLYPCGTTGEFLRMSTAERKLVAETVLKAAAGRLSVFIHVGAMRLDEVIELSQHAESIGADGIGVVTPQFFRCNDLEIEEFYCDVANSIGGSFPIYLYNIPQNTCNDISPSVAQRIIDRCQNVVGIKYSFPDMRRTVEYLSLNHRAFSVMHGTDTMFGAWLTLGCDGVVSGSASAFPEPYVALYDAFQKGDTSAVRNWTRVCMRFHQSMCGGSNHYASLAYNKACLNSRGVKRCHMRKPLLDLNELERTALHEKLSILCDSSGIVLKYC